MNHLTKNGFSKSENGHMIRISDLIWLEIDASGFAELIRKQDFGTKKLFRQKITIPKPVRTEKDVKLLLRALIG